MFRPFSLVLAAALLAVPPAIAQTPSPPGAKVYIISPADSETVSSPVKVQFGLTGMGIAPAGTDAENTGHHHIVVDRELPPLDDYLPTTDPQVIHFGKGQTETQLDLEPGEHTIQLIFADKDHLPHVPPVVSEKVTFTVK